MPNPNVTFWNSLALTERESAIWAPPLALRAALRALPIAARRGPSRALLGGFRTVVTTRAAILQMAWNTEELIDQRFELAVGRSARQIRANIESARPASRALSAVAAAAQNISPAYAYPSRPSMHFHLPPMPSHRSWSRIFAKPFVTMFWRFNATAQSSALWQHLFGYKFPIWQLEFGRSRDKN
jgi:hypothetical protein